MILYITALATSKISEKKKNNCTLIKKEKMILAKCHLNLDNCIKINPK